MSDDNFDDGSEGYVRKSDGLLGKLLLGTNARTKGKKRRTFPSKGHTDQNDSAAELMRLAATLAGQEKEREFSIHILSIHILNTYTHSVLSTLHKRQRVPDWNQRRLTNEKVKACFYHLALSFDHDDNLVPYVFNLSNSLGQSLQAYSGSEISLIYDRLQESFQQHLGSRLRLWMSLELGVRLHSKEGRYHVQGGVIFTPEQEDKIKKAFHAVNGDVKDGFKKYALMLLNKDHYRNGKRTKGRPTRIRENGRLATDLGWPLYNVKEQTAIKLNFNIGTKLIAADQVTMQRAKELYTQWRNAITNYYCLK